MMKNNLTELVFILDRSGSMSGLEADTIGGFNAMLEKQKQEPGDAYVSTILFSTDSTVIHDRVDLHHVPPMTGQDYRVGGGTALLDAIGDAIHHIGNVHKYARQEDVPARTLFVITTDGMENASRRYTLAKVRQMIGKEQEKYGWEFLFLGANMDAVTTAAQMGIAPTHAVDYRADATGTRANFEAIGDAVRCMRQAQPLTEQWKTKVKGQR